MERPAHVRRFENDGGIAFARTMKMEFVSADVDESSRGRISLIVQCQINGLICGPYQGEQQQTDD